MSNKLIDKVKDLEVRMEAPGLVIEPDDPRDILKSVKLGAHTPPSFSLRGYAHPVLDQGQTGACAAYTAVQMLYIMLSRLMQTSTEHLLPSPLALYYEARDKEGTLNQDAGVTLRGIMKTLKNRGMIPNVVFPERKDVFKAPPDFKNRLYLSRYERIPVNRLTPESIKTILFEEKLPIFGGFLIPRSQMSDFNVRWTGDFKDPPKGDFPFYAHAMLVTGYDEATNRFELLNSWGPDIGRGGWFTAPESWFNSNRVCMGLFTLSTELF